MFSGPSNAPGQSMNGDRPQRGDALGLVYFLANVHATCLTVPIRRCFGREALGWYGFPALLAMLCYASFSRSGAVLAYIALWLAFLISRRIETFRLLKRGAVFHSRYAGFP